MIAYFRDIKVEVLTVMVIGTRRSALVEAQSGEPFCRMTHGGPMNVNTAWLPYDCLILEPDHTCKHEHTVLDVQGILDWWPDGCPDDNRVERVFCLDCGKYLERKDKNDRSFIEPVDF